MTRPSRNAAAACSAHLIACIDLVAGIFTSFLRQPCGDQLYSGELYAYMLTPFTFMLSKTPPEWRSAIVKRYVAGVESYRSVSRSVQQPTGLRVLPHQPLHSCTSSFCTACKYWTSNAGHLYNKKQGHTMAMYDGMQLNRNASRSWPKGFGTAYTLQLR